jgi:hypothetical protein
VKSIDLGLDPLALYTKDSTPKLQEYTRWQVVGVVVGVHAWCCCFGTTILGKFMKGNPYKIKT